jgi:hypothetical protein
MKITPTKFRIGLLVVWALGSALLCWKIWADVEDCASCLPAGMNLSSNLYEPHVNWMPTHDSGAGVRTKLLWLGAYCKNGQIHDRWGTPILFQQIYWSDVAGLDGIPQMYHQERELDKLRQRFTVITYGSFKD